MNFLKKFINTLYSVYSVYGVISLILIVVLVYYIFSLKENYEWTMDNTIGNKFSDGLFTNQESSKHAFQTYTGMGSNDYTLYMGSDKTNGVSYIQSVRYGTSTAPLYLNARGGSVAVGENLISVGREIRTTPSGTLIKINANDMFNYEFSKLSKGSGDVLLIKFMPNYAQIGQNSSIRVYTDVIGQFGFKGFYMNSYITNIWSNNANYNTTMASTSGTDFNHRQTFTDARNWESNDTFNGGIKVYYMGDSTTGGGIHFMLKNNTTNDTSETTWNRNLSCTFKIMAAGYRDWNIYVF